MIQLTAGENLNRRNAFAGGRLFVGRNFRCVVHYAARPAAAKMARSALAFATKSSRPQSISEAEQDWLQGRGIRRGGRIGERIQKVGRPRIVVVISADQEGELP